MRLSNDNVFLDKHSQGEDTDTYMKTLAESIQLTEKIVKKNVKDSQEVIRRLRFQHTTWETRFVAEYETKSWRKSKNG